MRWQPRHRSRDIPFPDPPIRRDLPCIRSIPPVVVWLDAVGNVRPADRAYYSCMGGQLAPLGAVRICTALVVRRKSKQQVPGMFPRWEVIRGLHIPVDSDELEIHKIARLYWLRGAVMTVALCGLVPRHTSRSVVLKIDHSANTPLVVLHTTRYKNAYIRFRGKPDLRVQDEPSRCSTFWAACAL